MNDFQEFSAMARDFRYGGYGSDDAVLAVALYQLQRYGISKEIDRNLEKMNSQLTRIKPVKKDNRPEWMRLNQDG